MILGSVAAVIDKLVSWYTIARFVAVLHIHCTLHRGFIGGLVIGLKGLIQDRFASSSPWMLLRRMFLVLVAHVQAEVTIFLCGMD